MEAQAERTHIGIYSLFSLSLSSLLDHQKSLGQGPSMGNATRLMGYGTGSKFSLHAWGTGTIPRTVTALPDVSPFLHHTVTRVFPNFSIF